ncbi:hypothetical protein ACFFJY_03055 [Fictibacillus aquaticus]|uniref:Uncharacterized protein n=1 Tax=Fictibacillus aquaticus TaxID=2021314 RepID=A0A235FAB5_9BACL|nr:hypothetical protein [Fictibacillus aquaticus]OYD57675.1 hypothetical protein CGZ90_13505 [Fictibacillus aquaticus]
MKKRAMIFGVICNSIIFLVLFNSCEIFLGNKTKAEREAAAHLKEKYGKEFVIADVKYQFGNNTTYIEAYPKGHPEERFRMEGINDYYGVVRLVSPELVQLREMPVIFSCTPHSKSGKMDNKRYDQMGFSLFVAVVDEKAEQKVIAELVRIREKFNHFGSVKFEVAVKKLDVKTEANDYHQLMEDHKSAFELYCSDSIEGELQNKPRCSDVIVK